MGHFTGQVAWDFLKKVKFNEKQKKSWRHNSQMQCVDLHQILDLKPNQTKIKKIKTKQINKKPEKTIKDIYGILGGNSNMD